MPAGVIAPMVRAIAQQAAATEPPIVSCWVSAGWSASVSVEAGRAWPDRPSHDTAVEGLVGVLVALQVGRDRGPSVCGYLVDTWCLGVKDALGPRTMSRSELRRFVHTFFVPFGASVQAPIELARHLVWGGVDYARRLGFEPAPDFAPASGHLDPLTGPSAISFGRGGKPYYVHGPHDDAEAILAKLSASAGPDQFHYLVDVPIRDEPPGRQSP